MRYEVLCYHYGEDSEEGYLEGEKYNFIFDSKEDAMYKAYDLSRHYLEYEDEACVYEDVSGFGDMEPICGYCYNGKFFVM